jgi:hypothetical protein
VFSGISVTVRGDVEYLINRNTSGYVVTLLNNNGVFKPQQGMATVDRSAYVTVNITLRGQQIQSATDWMGDKQLPLNGRDGLSVQVAPGGISVIELKIKYGPHGENLIVTHTLWEGASGGLTDGNYSNLASPR